MQLISLSEKGTLSHVMKIKSRFTLKRGVLLDLKIRYFDWVLGIWVFFQGWVRAWYTLSIRTWWRHHMETFSALLALCEGNSPVTGEFPSQKPVTQSFDVFFDLRLNKRLSKQSWGWWFETPLCPLWRLCNEIHMFQIWVPVSTLVIWQWPWWMWIHVALCPETRDITV